LIKWDVTIEISCSVVFCETLFPYHNQSQSIFNSTSLSLPIPYHYTTNSEDVMFHNNYSDFVAHTNINDQFDIHTTNNKATSHSND